MNRIFATDINNERLISDTICITGHVSEKKNFQNGSYGIKIRDITGVAWCTTSDRSIYDYIETKDRIYVEGKIYINSRSNYVISISSYKRYNSLNINTSLLALQMDEQYAGMLMSQIIRSSSTIFRDSGYVEFDSKQISRDISDEKCLEPILVKYSGFGSLASLLVSPNAQLMDFMEITLLKCFTTTSSFSQSYRMPNTPSELKIIMSKALNIDEEEHITLIVNLFKKCLHKIVPSEQSEIERDDKSWGEMINYQKSNAYRLICYNSSIPKIGKNWNSTITRIYHLLDKENNILIEGAREQISNESNICTIVVYPSQILNVINKAPIRQIKNLNKLFYETV